MAAPHRLAFAALCCERLFPNYVAFAKKEGWGQVAVLRRCLDSLWEWICGQPKTRKEYEKVLRDCDEQIPDTEDFGSILASAALDASAAVYATLEACDTADDEKVADVAEAAVETICMFLQHRDNLDYSVPADRRRILADPLMLRELAIQEEQLERLPRIVKLDPEAGRRLREAYRDAAVLGPTIQSSGHRANRNE